MRILHVSDLHFGRFFQGDVAAAFARQCKSLDHDVVVVSGDLTHRARPGEFERARDFLEKCSEAPKVIVPGNHDIPLYRFWERLASPRRAYRRVFPDQLPAAHDIGSLRIVGIDSTDHRRPKAGRISRDTLARALELFEQRRDACFRVLVMHHNLSSPPGVERHKPVADAERMLERLLIAKVNVVLSGHLHHAFVATWPHSASSESACGRIILCNCGTTTARRGQHSESYSFNVLQCQQDSRILVEHWVYDPTQTTFTAGTARTFSI